MLFDKVMITVPDDTAPSIVRNAVRGIAIRGSKILMIKTNRGDYKLPGGGIESGEKQVDALVREVAEETGYRCLTVSHQIGKLIERHMDIYDSNNVFEMVSHYHTIEVSDEPQQVNLSGYENELDFVACWVEPRIAIEANIVYEVNKKEIVGWTQREIEVLETIERISLDTIANQINK